MRKKQATELLEKSIEGISDLRKSPGIYGFKRWYRTTKVTLKEIFKYGENLREFSGIFSVPDEKIKEECRNYKSSGQFSERLSYAKALLESMKDEVELFRDDDGDQPTTIKPAFKKSIVNSNDIFVIHGRDNAMKETVARFIMTLGLNPVILHEQANQGQTIIEKLEKHSDVGFAVALFTPDDEGSLTGRTKKDQRARQNVVLEFGYFIGKFGRDRVVALVKGNIERPSDMSGIIYIPLDDGGAWKMSVIQELIVAGYDIDANKALS